MILAKWTITAHLKWDDLTLTREEIDYFLDILYDRLNVDMIKVDIGYSLEPYGIEIEVQDG